LTPERLSLLSILAYSGPKSISELAAIEMVSLPAITRIVNYLEALNLVSRDRKTDDGRVVRVTATAAGLKLMEDGRRRRVENVARELDCLKEDELAIVAQATEMLARIGENYTGGMTASERRNGSGPGFTPAATQVRRVR
jgi:DNA-binding MarR family transcriptional regulator